MGYTRAEALVPPFYPIFLAEQKYWRGAGRAVLQGLFRRAPPYNPLKDFLKKVLKNPKNFKRNSCLFVHIGFGYTFSLLTSPANFPFRAPRDLFFGLVRFHRLKATGNSTQKAK